MNLIVALALLAAQPDNAADVVVTGDLADAQRIYARLTDLQPPPHLTVNVVPRKGRKELIAVGGKPVAAAYKFLEEKEDPFSSLAKSYHTISLVLFVAAWDMRDEKDFKATIDALKNGIDVDYGKPLMQFYFPGENRRFDLDELEEAGWKQLERRGVKIIRP
jgi:hypothetical protein